MKGLLFENENEELSFLRSINKEQLIRIIQQGPKDNDDTNLIRACLILVLNLKSDYHK